MSTAEIDQRYVWHPFTQMSEWAEEAPLVIERGEGCYLIDDAGRRYFDGVASLWVNVHGHAHPVINAAIEKQLAHIAHSTLLGLAGTPSALLARRLVECSPPGLERVFYSDSGSTAVEIALKQAFQYWQLVGRRDKRRFIYLEDAYHGDTLGAVAVGGISLFHEIFGPLLGGDHLRCARPSVGSTPAERCERGLQALEQVLADHGRSCAALIIEPLVQGAGGVLIQPPGYLAGVARLCAEHEVLLIADEVATGFGRTGRMFACEHEDVRPDLMCLAKGITGGYLPLAATLSSDRIYEAFLAERADGKAFFHGHTYTGNALACSAALASLELFEASDLLGNVVGRAAQFSDLLGTLAERLPWVHEVRQRGLMIGVELRDSTGECFDGATFVGAKVCAALRNHGVVLRPLGDTIVVMPPLVIDSEQVEMLCEALEAAIRETCG